MREAGGETRLVVMAVPTGLVTFLLTDVEDSTTRSGHFVY